MSKEKCKFTGFPEYRSCWWSRSKEPYKFTGFPGQGPCWWYDQEARLVAMLLVFLYNAVFQI